MAPKPETKRLEKLEAELAAAVARIGALEAKLVLKEGTINQLLTTVGELQGKCAISTTVTSLLSKQMNHVQRLSQSNAQYSRRETVEIHGFPESIPDKNVEENLIKVAEEIGVEIHPEDIKAAHKKKRQAYSRDS